jgi:hypothetical protein
MAAAPRGRRRKYASERVARRFIYTQKIQIWDFGYILESGEY